MAGGRGAQSGQLSTKDSKELMSNEEVQASPLPVVPFDLIVIGAGINGLGIARDAASRGLRVAVVEQDDLCSGVSAWSGRLIHGGLRYLEHKDFALVRESLKERERLFKLAPHLVRPVPLLMPFYAKNKRPAWLIRLGMIAYDVLSFDKTPPNHRILSREKVLARFGGMEKKGLGGAALFIDGQVEYAERLCVELAIAAQADGAVILTHSRVDSLLSRGTTVTGVRYSDAATGESREIYGSVVMNAAGPWLDWVLNATPKSNLAQTEKQLIGGSKGSHIIVDAFEGAPTDVVYYESQSDGRLVLVIPWMGRFLIGCTDALYEDEPGTARAESNEVEYLLAEVNALIPQAKLTVDDILFTYSGVRPLPYAPGVPEWKIPRSHVIHDHAGTGRKGLFSVVGGKLTTFRQLAEDAVDITYRSLGRPRTKTSTRDMPLPGARVANWPEFQKAFIAAPGLDRETKKRLLKIYGVRADSVLDLVRADASLGEKFDPLSNAIAAELVFAVKYEMAKSLTDVYARRTLIAFEPDHGLASVSRAADILGETLGWDAQRRAVEIAGYEKWLEHLAVPGRALKSQSNGIAAAGTGSGETT
ncbi:glycerol-3-phosphate dehydrogenase [Cryobacterium levicorallinum]|uniref:Glycerol-3-phosphate dehydrogenase n=2 Tax=Cryobacterium levicorallinum TaxID=995038 RepID=A0ABY1E9P9_9MICO|nr:glycerol-3-phosphate dehydrogenase [Cryobacterium levicorallinum]